MHGDLRPQLTEIVHQVEGETVVVVDEKQHSAPKHLILKVFILGYHA
jgi:hypothetical protein